MVKGVVVVVLHQIIVAVQPLGASISEVSSWQLLALSCWQMAVIISVVHLVFVGP